MKKTIFVGYHSFLKGLEGELSYIEENKPIVAIRIDGLGYACVSVEKINLELI